MASEPHTYRVLVFRQDDEREPIEVISVATDFHVSIAAWVEAIRRRPGLVLHHMNGRHRMERMVAPGTPAAAERDMTIGDLCAWHYLRLYCLECSHQLRFEAAFLAGRLGAGTTLKEAERRSWCKKCRSRNTRLEVHSMPR